MGMCENAIWLDGIMHKIHQDLLWCEIDAAVITNNISNAEQPASKNWEILTIAALDSAPANQEPITLRVTFQADVATAVGSLPISVPFSYLLSIKHSVTYGHFSGWVRFGEKGEKIHMEKHIGFLEQTKGWS
jgi:hypothetical protein